MDFVDVIYYLLSEGIDITLKKIDGNVWYDLNTGMKSKLWIAPTTNGEFKFSTRYSEGVEELSIRHLLYLARHCLHGRDYMSSAWRNLLIKEGLIEVETETVTKVVLK